MIQLGTRRLFFLIFLFVSLPCFSQQKPASVLNQSQAPQQVDTTAHFDKLDSVVYSQSTHLKENKVKQSVILDDWDIERMRRSSRAGILIFSLGSTLLLGHQLIATFTPQLNDGKRRYPLLAADLALIAASVPLLSKSGTYAPLLASFSDASDSTDTSMLKTTNEFGILAGFSLATISPLDFEFDAIFHRKFGLQVGFEFLHKFSDFFGIHAEVSLAQKGCVIDSESVNKTVYLDYVEIPLTAHALLPLKTGIRPSAYCGLASLLLLRSDMKIDNSQTVENQDIDNITRSGIGLIYGVRGSLTIRKLLLSVEFRTFEGLTTLGTYFIDRTEKAKNRSFCVLLGCSLLH
ncbi:MAG: PorT family protein [Chitinivibrionales bacterium]|nr:PorT family protein [Chitinivibrionales bacterium]